MPLISVIVPVYKVEKYLNRCVDSILAQTYREIEVILVDDGSPDGCGALCDEYAARDERVRVIHQQNQGLSAARNSGLTAANGEYFAFIDSDDYIREDMLETLLRELEKCGADFIKSDYLTFTDGETPEDNDDELAVTIYTPMEALDDSINTRFSATKHMKPTAWDALYKRKMFFDGDVLAVKYPVGKINEDSYVFPELIFRAEKIAHINRAFYYYYTRPDSIMHSGISVRQMNSCDIWRYIDEKILPYTDKYREVFAVRSLKRYLTTLEEIHKSEYRREWFGKVRAELLSDRKRLMGLLTRKYQKIALYTIRCYPVYWLVQKVFFEKLLGVGKK